MRGDVDAAIARYHEALEVDATLAIAWNGLSMALAKKGDLEAAIEAAEIARKNAEAEAKFKKKFGNAKPSAGALLHRQRQHETRYFDSGEAFSGVSKKEDPLASEDDTHGPLAAAAAVPAALAIAAGE